MSNQTVTAERHLGALSAATMRVEGPVDLLAAAGAGGLVFSRGGIGRAARGAAAVIELPGGSANKDILAGVTERLGAIRHVLGSGSEDLAGRPGVGPVAMGALPFDLSGPARLVVPAWSIHVDSDGSAWTTTVGEGDPSLFSAEAPRGSPSLGWPASVAHGGPPQENPNDESGGAGKAGGPDQFDVKTWPSHQGWRASVERALQHIEDGRIAKVVLARQVTIETNRPIRLGLILRRLASLYPTCTVFCVDGFIGASPELLISRYDDVVVSHPLAGTVAPDGGDLMGSAKERDEHRLVVDAVARVLAPLCSDLTVPESPAILKLRNVLHLGSLIEGRLRLPSAAPDALGLAALLHPTPAVAGTPRSEALGVIAELETIERGLFSGPVGWVDAAGNGEWVLGIRSATVHGNRAELFAGAGIVAGSDPDSELEETQLKLQPLLAAIVRP